MNHIFLRNNEVRPNLAIAKAWFVDVRADISVQKPDNAEDGDVFIIKLVQGPAGGSSITGWDNTYRLAGGTAPSLGAPNGDALVMQFVFHDNKSWEISRSVLPA